jgi:hypothetical protein
VEAIAKSMKRKSRADIATLHTEDKEKLSGLWPLTAICAAWLSLTEKKSVLTM